ncbi:hypothetical protein BaRGS_00034714, partial [Batillaria attramentaria]
TSRDGVLRSCDERGNSSASRDGGRSNGYGLPRCQRRCFHKEQVSNVKYYGGTANLMDAKGLSAWQPTISAQPWLFSTKLVRLSELVRYASKKAALDQAISDYLMRVYLNVELRRVLNTLPSHLRSKWEVTNLNSRITTMVAKYPLVESEVEALGKEVMDTYIKLFLEEDNSEAELIYANSIMKKVDFSCPTGKSIIQIQSWHSDWHDDRRWAFKCSYLKDLYLLGNCYWTDWLYEVGTRDWKYSCNGNRVIKGWYSQHHDWWDTRKHKLRCCEVLMTTDGITKFAPSKDPDDRDTDGRSGPDTTVQGRLPSFS